MWVKLENLVGKWGIKWENRSTDWCEFITNKRVIHLNWVDWWVIKGPLGTKFINNQRSNLMSKSWSNLDR